MSTNVNEEEQLNLAYPVSERVQIEEVCVLKAAYSRSPEFSSLPVNINVAIDVSTKLTDAKDRVFVKADFTLQGTFGGEETQEPPVKITASFLVRYRLRSAEELEDANFDAFGKINGVHNAWPFWREFVQSSMWRLGLPSLTIPVLPPKNNRGSALVGKPQKTKSIQESKPS
jgi:hypothetical protein